MVVANRAADGPFYQPANAEVTGSHDYIILGFVVNEPSIYRRPALTRTFLCP